MLSTWKIRDGKKDFGNNKKCVNSVWKRKKISSTPKIKFSFLVFIRINYIIKWLAD